MLFPDILWDWHRLENLLEGSHLTFQPFDLVRQVGLEAVRFGDGSPGSLNGFLVGNGRKCSGFFIITEQDEAIVFFSMKSLRVIITAGFPEYFR
jgi:hypothetical protein